MEYRLALTCRRRRASNRSIHLDASNRPWAYQQAWVSVNLPEVPVRLREARHRKGLLKRVGIEIRTHLESTRKRALRLEKTDQAAVRSLLNGLQ